MRNHIKIRTLSADSVCHDANFYRTVCVYVPEYVMRVCVRSRAFVCVYARMCGVCVYARMRGVCFVYARMRGVCVCMPECVVYVCVCVCVCPNAWCVYVPECVCNLALCSAGTIHRFMFKMIWRKIWVGLNNEPDFMRWKTNMDFKPWPVKTFRKSKILIQIIEKKKIIIIPDPMFKGHKSRICFLTDVIVPANCHVALKIYQNPKILKWTFQECHTWRYQ